MKLFYKFLTSKSTTVNPTPMSTTKSSILTTIIA